MYIFIDTLGAPKHIVRDSSYDYYNTNKNKEYVIGSIVMGLWEDNNWYQGKIVGVIQKGNTYRIKFDDYDDPEIISHANLKFV